MPISIRPPDIKEKNPDYSIDRYTRLRNFVNQQIAGAAGKKVTLINWLPVDEPTDSNHGRWAAWFADPLDESEVTVSK